MKAVVYHGLGDIRLDDVPEPRVKEPTDAVVRLTASAICGTDLHMVRGTLPGMKEGTILGHEGVGVVEDVGPDVRDLRPGDRVVIPSTIGCGWCSYCRAGYYAQCDTANPGGGTCFVGGPESAGSVDGMQAEYVRVPFAQTGPVKLPESMSDDDAILLSDIVPTSWFAASLAEIHPGNVVAVFGAGIVGQLAMASAVLQGAGRVLAVDEVPSRLEQAQFQGAEPVDFSKEHPVEALRRLTGGIGPDRVIDCVGVDANRPHSGPAAAEAEQLADELDAERAAVAPHTGERGDNWHPGDAPSLALRWAVDAVAKAGTVSVIGVYPPSLHSFPIGEAMNKNLTVNMGNCNHRRYLAELIDVVASGRMGLAANLTQDEPMDDVIAAYEQFDRREPGWLKVKLTPQGAAARAA